MTQTTAPSPRTVLIATNETHVSPAQIEAYERLGFRVSKGLEKLFQSEQPYDVIHFYWPEELTGWKIPTTEQIEEIRQRLEVLASRSRLICEVHNIVPHEDGNAAAFTALFEAFYETMHQIGHFSAYSHEAFVEKYPSAASRQHIVHSPFNYLIASQRLPSREEARAELRLSPDDFAICLTGELRDPNEFTLAVKGFQKATVGSKKWLPAFRLRQLKGLKGFHRIFAYRRIQFETGLLPARYSIPDEKLHTLLRAADALLIPRMPPHLNSGLLYLGVECGTPIIAPDYGAFREYLGNTSNVLYKTGDATSLAAAIETMASRKSEEISQENSALAATWTWDRILSAHGIKSLEFS